MVPLQSTLEVFWECLSNYVLFLLAFLQEFTIVLDHRVTATRSHLCHCHCIKPCSRKSRPLFCHSTRPVSALFSPLKRINHVGWFFSPGLTCVCVSLQFCFLSLFFGLKCFLLTLLNKPVTFYLFTSACHRVWPKKLLQIITFIFTVLLFLD